MTETPTMSTLRKSDILIRRARLRRLLNSRTGKEGLSRITDIANELGETRDTTRLDLHAIGAVKVVDTIDGERCEWWIIPAWNPLLPNMRDYVNETTLLNEISLKLQAHALEVFVIRDEVIIKTERSAGPLLADWISLLPWSEILHVTEQRSSVIVRAPDPGMAMDIHKRLLGKIDEDDT